MAVAHMRSALRAGGRARTHRPRMLSTSSTCQLTRYSPAKAQVQSVTQRLSTIDQQPPPSRILPTSRPTPASAADLPRSSKAFFDATGLLWVGTSGDQPPDPNKAKLGRTLRILQERLPNLFQSPLPQDILAPNISLHLFPSTHPHLPTVSGRVAYNAALWTSPIAWNRVPLFGNVQLEILAERVTSEPLTFLPRRQGAIPEQLVVRWCEKRKAQRRSSPVAEAMAVDINSDTGAAGIPETTGGGGGGGIARSLGFGGGGGVEANKAFKGLFIFDFDQEGRILSHTIETAQANGTWEKGVGAKFVGLTDWLLGGIRDPGSGTPVPMFERITRR